MNASKLKIMLCPCRTASYKRQREAWGTWQLCRCRACLCALLRDEACGNIIFFRRFSILLDSNRTTGGDNYHSPGQKDTLWLSLLLLLLSHSHIDQLYPLLHSYLALLFGCLPLSPTKTKLRGILDTSIVREDWHTPTDTKFTDCHRVMYKKRNIFFFFIIGKKTIANFFLIYEEKDKHKLLTLPLW